MRIADAMTPRADVVTAELPGTRDDVLEYLQDRGFSSVPVVKPDDGGERYRGLVTREDLIEHPDEDQLALLMREVPTAAADDPLQSAVDLMRAEGTRRVPIVDTDGGLAGILTVTDVVRAIARDEVDGETTVGGLATRNVNTTWQGTPLTVAERELAYANVPYAVVLDDDASMVGIVTEVDVIAVARIVEGEADAGDAVADQDDEWMWEGIKAVGSRYVPTRNVEIPAEPVAEFMSDDLLTVSKRRTAREAARTMLSNDVEQLPLVDGDELVGVVRDVDLLGAIVG
jgi:CBS domain-containing protein